MCLGWGVGVAFGRWARKLTHGRAGKKNERKTNRRAETTTTHKKRHNIEELETTQSTADAEQTIKAPPTRSIQQRTADAEQTIKAPPTRSITTHKANNHSLVSKQLRNNIATSSETVITNSEQGPTTPHPSRSSAGRTSSGARCAWGLHTAALPLGWQAA